MKVFVCQTPFQLYYANTLIRHFNSLFNNLEFLVIYSNSDIKNEKWPSNVSFEFFDNSRGFISKLSHLRSILRVIKSEIKTKSKHQIDFFIPHISGFIANYIYYNSTIRKSPNIKINFFFEGILYFYDFEEKLKVYHIHRFILAMILGFRYRHNKTILPYYSNKINKIYTPLKKFTMGAADKLVEVPLPSQRKENENQEAKDTRFVILGGPVDYSTEFYTKSLEDITKQNRTNFTIFYKGHASFHTHNNRFKDDFSNVARKHMIDYTEIIEQEPIEKLIHNISPNLIYSYYSSALINIQLMSQNRYHMKCFIGPNDNIMNQLRNVFEHFDIEIIELKA